LPLMQSTISSVPPAGVVDLPRLARHLDALLAAEEEVPTGQARRRDAIEGALARAAGCARALADEVVARMIEQRILRLELEPPGDAPRYRFVSDGEPSPSPASR